MYAGVSGACVQEAGMQVIVYGDFVSGPRCEREQGGPPTSRTIERGDLLLLDFSVVVAGYRAQGFEIDQWNDLTGQAAAMMQTLLTLPRSPIGLQAFVPNFRSKAENLTTALADGRLRAGQQNGRFRCFR